MHLSSTLQRVTSDLIQYNFFVLDYVRNCGSSRAPLIRLLILLVSNCAFSVSTRSSFSKNSYLADGRFTIAQLSQHLETWIVTDLNMLASTILTRTWPAMLLMVLNDLESLPSLMLLFAIWLLPSQTTCTLSVPYNTYFFRVRLVLTQIS